MVSGLIATTVVKSEKRLDGWLANWRKRGAMEPQTQPFGELVGSTKLSLPATCHITGFTASPFLLFTFRGGDQLFFVASFWGVWGWGGGPPCSAPRVPCHTSEPQSSSPLRRAPFSPQSRAADAAPRLGHVTRRGGLFCAARSVFFLPRVQWAPCGPTPSLFKGCLCAQCRLLFSARGESEGAKGRKY